MTAALIDGKVIAAALRARVMAAVRGLADGHGIVPGLAVVLVGDRSRQRGLCRRQDEDVGGNRHEVDRSPAGGFDEPRPSCWR